MRKLAYTFALFVAFVTLSACSHEETYGDKKDKERDAISQFIADSAIQVIDEATFLAQDSTTDVTRNQFVYLEKSGVYMQIVRKGTGTPLEENKSVNILCRYYEYNILNNQVTSYNASTFYGHFYERMTVTRNGVNYSAVFDSNQSIMSQAYSSTTVPAGWLVPLQYIKLGRQQDEIAKVRLIVPHSQGHSIASTYVYPYYYIITYQRER